MNKKPIIVKQKQRFRALAMPLVNESGLRPELASSDYILFPIHDGSANAIRVSRDSYFGQSEMRSKYPQWYSFDIALTFNDTDPEAPKGSKIHYMFKMHSPFKLDYEEMKNYANRVLEELFHTVGRGVGSIYASMMPESTVAKLIDQGKIEKSDRPMIERMFFDEWTIGFTDDLHYVDPKDIPTWEKPVYR